ncbi:MAG TPA: hypothetical protein EYH40_04090 [Desulfurococcales archaeon]|nr:hypothetical protein [Desulfurococcales archaeon]
MRIVVIGYGTAGMTAASYAKLVNRRAEVVAFEKRSYAVYHPCSIPDVLAGTIDSWDKLRESAVKMPGLTVYTGTEVYDIDHNNRIVYARRVKDGSELKIEYDKLILATGSKPRLPRGIPGLDLEGVFTIKTVEDGEKLDKWVKSSNRVVVVGGGAIGVEVASALAKRGLNVTLVEMTKYIAGRILDSDMSLKITKMLRERGIRVVTEDTIAEIKGKDSVEKVVTGKGEVYDADAVVFTIGMVADTTLAKRIGVEITERGLVRVNDRMETSVKDVYAAGDIVEVKDLITGKPTVLQLASVAFREGRVAGINAAGGNAVFPGAIKNIIVHTPWFYFGGVGLTSDEASAAGFNVISTTVSTWVKPEFYRDSTRITVKLIVDADSSRVLGVQVIGEYGVEKELNMASTIIKNRMGVSDILDIDIAYTPKVSDVYDPLHVAAEAILRKLKRYR